jgi:hypothetical protein
MRRVALRRPLELQALLPSCYHLLPEAVAHSTQCTSLPQPSTSAALSPGWRRVGAGGAGGGGGRKRRGFEAPEGPHKAARLEPLHHAAARSVSRTHPGAPLRKSP